MTDQPTPPVGDEPSVPPEQGQPVEGAAAPGRAAIQWPLPDKPVTFGGRTLSSEMAVVAAIYAMAAVWLFLATIDMWSFLPDLAGGLFGDPFEFVLAWGLVFVVGTVLYLIVGMAATSWLVFRAEPLGRGLSIVFAGLFVLTMFGGATSASYVLITLASVACAVALSLSPATRRAFAESPQRHGRPMPVVLAQTVAVSFFSLVGLLVVTMPPGLRFVGEVGATLLFFELLAAVATVLAFLGVRRLRVGPDRQARILLTVAAAIAFLGLVLGQETQSTMLGLGVAAAIICPLWLAPSARAWFGDPPLQTAA